MDLSIIMSNPIIGQVPDRSYESLLNKDQKSLSKSIFEVYSLVIVFLIPNCHPADHTPMRKKKIQYQWPTACPLQVNHINLDSFGLNFWWYQLYPTGGIVETWGRVVNRHTPPAPHDPRHQNVKQFLKFPKLKSWFKLKQSSSLTYCSSKDSNGGTWCVLAIDSFLFVILRRILLNMKSKIFLSNRSVFLQMFANWARAKRANIGCSNVWISIFFHQIVAKLS